jgi:DNA (cytosine-5)-methyltransferase 1
MSGGPSLLDLFSGAGGFARGFKDEGFRVLLAIDNDKSAARSYSANFPGAITIREDIREVTCDDIRYFLGLLQVDVVIGSPPCEPFTASNPRRREDPLERLYSDPVGTLVLEFVRILECVKPKLFVMENVPGILEGSLKAALRKELGAVGYSTVYFNVLRAEEYGTPSRRTRVFISNVPISPPKSRKAVTVWEAIGDLPPPSQDPLIPNHEPPPSLSLRKLKKVSKLKPGGALVRYRGSGGKLYPNLIKLDPGSLAPTILGSSRFIHPYEPRLITVREQARLMSFPDDHVFFGGKDEQYNQAGEAVPPALSRAIARYLLRYLI